MLRDKKCRVFRTWFLRHEGDGEELAQIVCVDLFVAPNRRKSQDALKLKANPHSPDLEGLGTGPF